MTKHVTDLALFILFTRHADKHVISCLFTLLKFNSETPHNFSIQSVLGCIGITLTFEFNESFVVSNHDSATFRELRIKVSYTDVTRDVFHNKTHFFK